MIRKIKKMISIILVISIIFSPLSTKADDEITYPQKGDLRCPGGISTNKCKMYDENGNEIAVATSNVKRVEVTEVIDNFTVTKVVEILNKLLGEYNVYFKITANEMPSTISKPVYIVVIRDASASMKGDVRNNSVEATKEFAKKLVSNQALNANLALIQFGTKITPNSFNTFKHEDFDEIYFCNTFDDANKNKDFKNNCSSETVIKDSNINRAFVKAGELLDRVDGKKYVVVLGDGRYWNPIDNEKAAAFGANTQATTVRSKFGVSNLIKKDIKIYEIYYLSEDSNGSSGYSFDYINCQEKYGTKKKYCDKNFMSILIKYDLANANNNKNRNINYNESIYAMSTISTEYGILKDATILDFDNIFTDFYNDIVNNNVNNKFNVSIKDNMGSKFTTDEGRTNKTFFVNMVTGFVSETEKIKIKIDASAEKGWHDTNNKFSINDKSPSSNDDIDPEVYWEPENRDLQSCSDGATIRNTSNISTSKYYIVTCEQGYDALEGFQANLNINTLNKGTKYFKINYATGFPINLVMSNNIRCTYHFDIESFNDDYQKELSEFNTNSSADVQTRKVINSNYNKIIEGYKLLYSDSSENSLNKYAETFYKSNPKVIVKYKSSEIEEFDLVRTDNENNRAICNSGTNETVNGVSIINDRVCTLSVSKAMQFPLMCINASKPIPEICVKNTNQLVGGNLLYPNIKEKGGYISVSINNADIFGRSVLLEGDKVDKDASTGRCEFDVMSNPNNSGKKFYYRQIDVSDPFVQKFQTINKRSVGSNFLNSNYNFVKIIDSDIWNSTKEPEYFYRISKENIENIKNSTQGDRERVNSYLGSDCKIKSDTNEYMCSFVRNFENNQRYFTYFKIK